MPLVEASTSTFMPPGAEVILGGQVLMKHPLIEEIETSGLTTLSDGARVPVHSNMGPESGRLIQLAIETIRPSMALEVGLAFGISTLYILDAMQSYGAGRLIGIDPAGATRIEHGGRLHNVEKASSDDRYLFYEERSHVVLPRLEDAGTQIQFALIDGWHTFDYALVDFFFVDRMLDVGEIIVLDDVGLSFDPPIMSFHFI